MGVYGDISSANVLDLLLPIEVNIEASRESTQFFFL